METREFFNAKAGVWDAEVPADAARLERLAERLKIKEGSVVLDVGTGTGVFLPYLSARAERSGRIVAVDVAAEMLRQAQAKSFPGNITFLCADIVCLPLPDGVFDIVVCHSSFPHFQDKARALREIYRVTRPGGRLAICHTSSRSTINGIHSRIPAVAHDLIPDEAEMRRLLTGAGFRDIEITDGAEEYLCRAERPV